MTAFEIRIVDTGLADVDSISENPRNWRNHPVRQADAVKESLSGVGWVESLLVNLRTGEAWPPDDRNQATLINGHLRLALAKKAGQKQVPVIYVDLTPEEEAYILVTLDPLAALAVTDNDKLLSLTTGLDQTLESIKHALRGAGVEARQTFSHIQDPDSPGGAGGSSQPGRPPEIHRPPEGGTTSKPKDREIYPLAIVLDRRGYDRWQAWKTSLDVRSDTEALRALLDKVLEFTEGE